MCFGEHHVEQSQDSSHSTAAHHTMHVLPPMPQHPQRTQTWTRMTKPPFSPCDKKRRPRGQDCKTLLSLQMQTDSTREACHPTAHGRASLPCPNSYEPQKLKDWLRPVLQIKHLFSIKKNIQNLNPKRNAQTLE